MFQDLRELRTLRLEHDREFGPSSLFILALEVASGDLFVYLPPGSTDFAKLYGAWPCEAPVFQDDTLRLMSEEGHPAQPPKRMMTGNGQVIESHQFDAPCPERLERGLDPEL